MNLGLIGVLGCGVRGGVDVVLMMVITDRRLLVLVLDRGSWYAGM